MESSLYFKFRIYGANVNW